jgi:hypothetical protein
VSSRSIIAFYASQKRSAVPGLGADRVRAVPHGG